MAVVDSISFAKNESDEKLIDPLISDRLGRSGFWLKIPGFLIDSLISKPIWPEGGINRLVLFILMSFHFRQPVHKRAEKNDQSDIVIMKHKFRDQSARSRI